MRILGLQKLTLLDYPGRTACTVFAGGCNFRCPFCHNAPLVTGVHAQPPFAEEEVLSYLQKRTGLLDGVCVSGGEPTLQPDLPDFLRKIRSLGYAVKLDTNGSRPGMLKALIREGLIDYAAMDLKSSPEEYARACGLPVEWRAIEESIGLLMQGLIEYEFRTTVVAELHNEQIISRAAQHIAGARRYYLQAFVDSGALIAPGYHAASRGQMLACLQAARAYVPEARLRGCE